MVLFWYKFKKYKCDGVLEVFEEVGYSCKLGGVIRNMLLLNCFVKLKCYWGGVLLLDCLWIFIEKVVGMRGFKIRFL